MSIRRFLLLALAVLGSQVSGVLPVFGQARDPQSLDVMQADYPRAFFFRATESAFRRDRYPTYGSWAGEFDRLQGIMGKCLEEECLGREPRNAQFFSRFKQQRPRQSVMLHFNGNARDPRYQTENYFAGHWIYRQATAVTAAIPAESGESLICVEDVTDFKTDAGRYRTASDDLALFAMTPDGKHDWQHCEQVQLIAVDPATSTIRVRRGCYGSKPLAFEPGRSRVAAHQTEGPWGPNNHIMWFYNYTTHCPRDQEGKTCADRLVDDLATWFGPDGPLADFDGLEFDVLFHETNGDTDGDGTIDRGVIDGVNQYGIGVVSFAKQLRERMGDDFLLQGDGALGRDGSRSQRAWGIFNGIESEGWPNLHDWEFEDWSGGFNRMAFWQANARPPVFNYVNHKWVESVPGKPGVMRQPELPMSRHRLALAACQMFNAAVCYSTSPPSATKGQIGIWDELRCGAANQLGWLGQPLGPAVSLATQTANGLGDSGRGTALADRIVGPVTATAAADGVALTTTDPGRSEIQFRVDRIPVSGSDVTIEVEMNASPMLGYPHEVARLARIGLSGGMISLMDDTEIATGMRLRGAREDQPLDRSTGASFQSRELTIGETTLPAYHVHPPYRGVKGATFWSREISVSANFDLRFSIAMGPLSPQRSDGVTFQVFAQELPTRKGTTAPSLVKLFEKSTNKHHWMQQQIPLDAWAGKRVLLTFVADCGPNDNATTDQAYWGDVQLVDSKLESESITPLVKRMTWVNDRTFASRFYFRHVRSPTIDLTFTVEGNEPVKIQSIAVHSHPDVTYRRFEKGIVLANPSLQEQRLDLRKIAAGDAFRYIKGTANQDPQTNHGGLVGRYVTLGPLDGLFLQQNQ